MTAKARNLALVPLAEETFSNSSIGPPTELINPVQGNQLSVKKHRNIGLINSNSPNREWQPSQVRKLTYFGGEKEKTPALAKSRNFADISPKTLFT